MEAPVFVGDKFGAGRWVGVTYVLDRCPICNGARTMAFTGQGMWGCHKCKHGGKDLQSFRDYLGKDSMLKEYVQYVVEPERPPEIIVVSKYVNQHNGKVIATGFGTLDRQLGGLQEASLTIITGKRGHGKSTWIGCLVANAIHNGHVVAVYSGELSAGGFQNWMFSQLAGTRYVESHVDQFGATRWMVQRRAEDAIRKWLAEKLLLYDSSKVGSNERGTIIRMFQKARTYYGADLFIVDNLMCARMDQDGADDANRAAANFAAELLNFARENAVAVILVAHPRKGSSQMQDTEDINESVAGLADITNLASNVIQVKRLSPQEKQMHGCDCLVTVGKNRQYGDEGAHKFNYDVKSRRYIPTEGSCISQYGWTKFLESEAHE